MVHGSVHTTGFSGEMVCGSHPLLKDVHFPKRQEKAETEASLPFLASALSASPQP